MDAFTPTPSPEPSAARRHVAHSTTPSHSTVSISDHDPHLIHSPSKPSSWWPDGDGRRARHSDGKWAAFFKAANNNRVCWVVFLAVIVLLFLSSQSLQPFRTGVELSSSSGPLADMDFLLTYPPSILASETQVSKSARGDWSTLFADVQPSLAHREHMETWHVSKLMPISQPAKLNATEDRPGQPLRADRGVNEYALAAIESPHSSRLEHVLSVITVVLRDTLLAGPADKPGMWSEQKLPVEDSLLHGTFQQLSWVIAVEEGLSEKRMQLVTAMRTRLSEDQRVTFISIPAGTREATARNLAASHEPVDGMFNSPSRYLLFARPNSRFEPTFLEKLVLFLHFHPHHSMAHSWRIGVVPSSTTGQGPTLNEISWTGFGRGADNLESNHFPTETMISRDAFDLAGGYDDKLLVALGVELQPDTALASTIDNGATPLESALFEWDFYLRLLHAGKWGGMVSEFLLWECASEGFTGAIGFGAIAHAEAKQMIATSFRRRHAHIYQRSKPLAIVTRELEQDFSDAPLLLPPATFNVLRTSPNTRTPHLLLVTHWSVVGGAEWMNIRVIKELRLRGWTVTVVFFLREELTNTVLPHYRRWTDDVFILPSLLRQGEQSPALLQSLIHSRRPNVVILTNSEAAYMSLEYVRRKTEELDPTILFIDYMHNETPEWKQGGYARYSVQYRHLLDRSLFCAEANRRWAVERGHSDATTGVMYIGTDILARKSRFGIPTDQVSLRDEGLRTSMRAQYGISADTVVILYVARLTEVKLPLVFARSVVELTSLLHPPDQESTSSRDFHAFVVGDGEMRDQMEEMVNSQANVRERVTFLGIVTSESLMHALYSMGDIVYLPSRNEGISMGLMEGMAYGLTPVSVRIGGQAEVIESGKSGFLIELDLNDQDGMAVQFAEVFSGLVKNPDALRLHSDQALARIQSFSEASMITSLLGHFSNALQDRMSSLDRQRSLIRHYPILLRTLRANQLQKDSLIGENVRSKADCIRIQDNTFHLWQQHLQLRSRYDPTAAGYVPHVMWRINPVVQFEQGVKLEGASISVRGMSANGRRRRLVTMRLMLHVLSGNLSVPLGVFGHFESVLDPSLKFYGDHQFSRSSREWRAGELIFDDYEFSVPSDIPAGNYVPWFGFYDTDDRVNWTRLKIVEAESVTDADDNRNSAVVVDSEFMRLHTPIISVP